MPVYRRKGSPCWWFSISIGGVRFRGSTGKANEREARIFEAEELSRLIKRQRPADGWRLRDVLGTYWSEHAERARSADDIFHQFELLNAFLGPDLPVADLTNAMLMDYRAARRGGSIRKNGEKVRPVAAQTVNRDLSHLQAALNWARDVHGRAIPAIAWSRLKVREAPHRIRFAGGDEFAALLTAAHPAIRPVLLCAVTTGLRKANILRLEWHQVDLRGGTITVPVTKGGKPHTVRIVPALRAELGRTDPEQRRGRVFDTVNFRKRWQAALAAANMTDFRFHDLRHTFASWARQNGADLADICDALGHSSVSVTMRYAHIKPDTQTTAFDRVGALFTAARGEMEADDQNDLPSGRKYRLN